MIALLQPSMSKVHRTLVRLVVLRAYGAKPIVPEAEESCLV
ncbi:hypothetical protein T260_07120 [Geobacillus thermopakistaniensis]|uniref:Uncharacterized protein n=1 Tax=Geobacillus thermopakistaniensis (strain MAS1) TaxID=1408282 RepID=A0A7U9JBR8_GEOTM|nr:hypothetical protein T260_07120 [Geobacillus sp. MAS1]